MAKIKTKEEIEILREGGKKLARILRLVSEAIVPGISARELDELALELAQEGGDTPAFLNYSPDGARRPFPATLCVSINDEIVHGIPHEKEKIIKEGDVVSLDMGLIHKGLFTDAAVTVGVGIMDNKAKRLIAATERSLYSAIEAVRPGVSVNELATAVELVANNERFSIAEDLGGHGVGHEIHEDPFIPNYRLTGRQPRLEVGMVIAIEPMLCEGTGKIKTDKDGWTIKTFDGKRAAHAEHTVVVTETGSEILTQE